MGSKNLSNNPQLTDCVLIGISYKKDPPARILDLLEELRFLALTYEMNAVRTFIQKLEKPDPAYMIGKGKLKEVSDFIKSHQISTVIFDDELSPSQQRNIEKELKCTVLDRTQLILKIFEKRARTSYAKTQVEMARMQYLLPRLKGMWTHLERQRGGTGTRGGAGEKEIETDRRMVVDKIAQLRKKLAEIDKQMDQQRKKRGEMVRVSLVGYTNAGKSSLMNYLSKSELLAENKLFATLDTTVRKVNLDGVPFLLSDTVGFIRKLPTLLIESFKSTLDEVREADLLLHVVDISHPNFEEHIQVVQQTLKEINAAHIPSILVFNKIDAFNDIPPDPFDLLNLEEQESKTLEAITRSWMSKIDQPVVFISVIKKINLDALKEMLLNKVKEIYHERYPYVLPVK
jgi:GTP-binding protein HflX